MNMTREDYAHQLLALRPRGKAWPESMKSNQAKLLDEIAAEFARIDKRAWELLDEADPRTVYEMLADWEHAWGLPEPCLVAPETFKARVLALVEKVTRLGGQSKPYFIALAKKLGFDISIRVYSVRRCGDLCGMPHGGIDWMYVWEVQVSTGKITRRLNGEPCGERFQYWNTAELLECVFNRLKPAESILKFSYQ